MHEEARDAYARGQHHEVDAEARRIEAEAEAHDRAQDGRNGKVFDQERGR